MAQAFFSLSVGVGGMMVYGSYLQPNLSLNKVTKLVGTIAALDAFIAFLAGLLIIPALYVAQYAGQTVLLHNQLIGEGQLIFEVLPTLFQSMGTIGLVVAFCFFTLLSIAALTSTISVTEVPVSYLIEAKNLSRIKATWWVSMVVACTSLIVILFFEQLFSLVIIVLTTIIQPLMCLFYFFVVGWLWKSGNQLSMECRSKVNIKRKIEDMNEGKNEGKSKAENTNHLTLFLFSYYLRYICPILLTIIFVHVAF